MDFILNGQGHGNVATSLLSNGFDMGILRPWVGNDGRHYIAQNRNGKQIAVPTMNANATLRKDEWKILDGAVISAAKERLRIVADLRSRGLVYNIPNGMGKTVLETEAMGDITAATVSMDPARKSEGDRPEYTLTNLPLPVIHKDFYYNARQVATSRNTGAGLDVTTAQLAARRVAEEAERLVIGGGTPFKYGGGSIYGLTDFPNRLTHTLTAPTLTSWTPATLVQEILAMRQKSENAHHYGPWMVYTSPAWDEYLDDDYSASKGDNTLRQRIQQIRGLVGVETADYLTGNQIVLVQLTNDVIREVVGMDIMTLQWETDGGMRVHFKVMAILVPQLRADSNGNTGIVHGVAA